MKTIASISRGTKKRVNGLHAYFPIILFENNYWFCKAIWAAAIKDIDATTLTPTRIVPKEYYKINKLNDL